ncbi:MAG TPA: DctP family TRAP transporter solute-binding subunit [Candidatus Acidoferrales bacterium]|nr:DctP family TRAP transporter solute-binding subunit [Candidatus Acidoferrales bacterium]
METKPTHSPLAVTRRQSIAAIGATAASVFATVNFVRAQTPITVRLGDVVAEGDPEAAAHHFFAQRFSDLTKGAYEVKIFLNGTLGDPNHMNEQVASGALELTKCGSGALPTYDKRLDVINLPYMYTSTDKLFAALDGKLGDAFGEIIEPHGFKLLGFYDSGVRNIYNWKGPIDRPENIKIMGLRLRVQPSPLFIATFNQLGAQAVPLAVGEIYNAIQQHVVDGAENNIDFYLTQHHNEVAPYYSKTQHLFGNDVFIASAKWYATLPPDVQAALTQAAREGVEYERKAKAEATKADYAKCDGLGVKVNDADIPAFQAAVKPVWEQFKGPLGNLYDIVLATQ